MSDKKNLLVSIKNGKESSGGGYSTLSTTTTPLNLPLGTLNSSKLENTLLRSQNLNTAEYDHRKSDFRNVHGGDYQQQSDIDDESK
jgi:hypothetical protein